MESPWPRLLDQFCADTSRAGSYTGPEMLMLRDERDTVGKKTEGAANAGKEKMGDRRGEGTGAGQCSSVDFSPTMG